MYPPKGCCPYFASNLFAVFIAIAIETAASAVVVFVVIIYVPSHKCVHVMRAIIVFIWVYDFLRGEFPCFSAIFRMLRRCSVVVVIVFVMLLFFVWFIYRSRYQISLGNYFYVYIYMYMCVACWCCI